ncbi:high-affinity nickel-transporter [Striga asiatica]|uniref:High-affinity nickel-transporter n=1 Tax=Striga asiatica TaxID=4170 RepID=A0A5A7P0W0_STRAF|nr:high-affinity nickel-transporter [Striga asiatica]
MAKALAATPGKDIIPTNSGELPAPIDTLANPPFIVVEKLLLSTDAVLPVHAWGVPAEHPVTIGTGVVLSSVDDCLLRWAHEAAPDMEEPGPLPILNNLRIRGAPRVALPSVAEDE